MATQKKLMVSILALAMMLVVSVQQVDSQTAAPGILGLLLNPILRAVEAAGDSLFASINQLTKSLGVSGITNSLTSAIQTVVDDIGKTVNGLVSQLDAVLGPIEKIISGPLAPVVGDLGDALGSGVDALLTLVLSLANELLDLVESLISAGGPVGLAIQAVVTLVNELLNSVDELVQNLLKFVIQLLNNPAISDPTRLVQPLLAVLEGVLTTVGSLVDQIIRLLNLNNISESVASLLDVLLRAIETLLEQVEGDVQGILGNLTSALNNGTVGELLRDIEADVENLLSRIERALANSTTTARP